MTKIEAWALTIIMCGVVALMPRHTLLYLVGLAVGGPLLFLGVMALL